MTLDVLRAALQLFSARGARFLAAAVAFYALLSAAPLLVVVLTLVGVMFGRARAESALWEGLSHWVAPEGLAAIRGMTERLDSMGHSGSVLGAVLVVYGSTRLFRALHRALNQLWGVDLVTVEGSRPHLERYGMRYGTALLLTLFTAVLVVLLVLVKVGFAAITAVSFQPPPTVLWSLDALVSVALAFLLFLALFRFLPEASVTLREAALASGVSTVLFAIGSGLVTLYLHHKQMSDLYEGAAAVVIAVVWVYYSAQVVFLGACVGVAVRQAQREGTDARRVAATDEASS